MLALKSDPGQASSSVDEAVDDGGDLRGGWSIAKYACIDNWIEEGDIDGWTGRWSDHRAVRITIRRDG
jgi:hypothetical protein